MSAAASANSGFSPMRLEEAARIMREAVRDKSYRGLPLGEDVDRYLQAKQPRQAENTRKAYEASLDKLARFFPDLRVEDFEPPVGTERLEEYLNVHWGKSSPNTYNLHLSVLRSFFGFWQVRGRLQGDPTKPLEKPRRRQRFRATFSDDDRRRIKAAASTARDRIALRLMFDYGLRRGSLKAIRFRHFEHQRRKLTIFTKGSQVRTITLPDPDLWQELGRHILDVEAQPDHFLMCVERPIPRAGRRRFPDQEMSPTTIHRWFYRLLQRAELVPDGQFGSGRERNMHAARHTAAQRMLDVTGNIAAVQSLLGHASIATTADIYTEWDEERLAQSLREVLAKERES